MGPEHAYLKEIGRVRYVSVRDDEALSAFDLLSRYEGIIPALESAHAVAWAMVEATSRKSNEVIIINLSGRGDKDLEMVWRYRNGSKQL
ncbi:MAG: hypothetical protein N2260_00900 [Syntrophobacterales bacterium]|nr:hypothetical protein [Syntrophobacterales bacterium]